jgi:hypothetical protein
MVNQALKHYININKSHLHEELDTAIKLKNSCSYEDDVIGVKLTALTREKIFKILINIFKNIHYNQFNKVQEDLIKVNKKIRLHIYQMKKLRAYNLKENMDYFTDILKVCYSIVVKHRQQVRKSSLP